MTRPGRLVVSVHDVTPPTQEQVRRLRDLLDDIGVTRCSLLVIPNFRGCHPIDADAGFCAWLAGLRDRGDEIVLHGFEHVEVVAPTRVTERFKNRWYTKGEGEFLALDAAEAHARIAMGQAVLARAGFKADGFVAPAWLINDAGIQAARERGLQYTNSYLHVTDLANGRSRVAPSLVFGPGHLDEDIGIGLQRALSACLVRCPVVRVALHPPCVDHPQRLKRVLAMIAEQLHHHTSVTYLQLLQEMRGATAGASSAVHAS